MEALLARVMGCPDAISLSNIQRYILGYETYQQYLKTIDQFHAADLVHFDESLPASHLLRLLRSLLSFVIEVLSPIVLVLLLLVL